MLPVADSGEGIIDRRADRVTLPEVEQHGLARGLKMEAFRIWHTTVRVAIVLAPGKKGAMGLQIGNGLLPIVIKFDFHLNRVGAQVDQAIGLVMFRARFCAAVQVDDQRRRAIKLL